MGFSDQTCDGCGCEHYFSIYASMRCSTHKKDYCWACDNLGNACEKDGKRCNFLGITNPQWIYNLRNTLKNDPSA